MRFVCDCCHDLTNIEADRMEIQGDKLMVYSRGRLVYVADLGQIMLAKLTPGRQTGEDVMHWWMEDGVLPGQMVLEEMEEDAL